MLMSALFPRVKDLPAPLNSWDLLVARGLMVHVTIAAPVLLAPWTRQRFSKGVLFPGEWAAGDGLSRTCG